MADDEDEDNLPTEKPKVHRMRRDKNVLQMMTDYREGPLSLLLHYKEDKIRVRVLTRNHLQVRGICTGFIVAFDKHFNLAMVDIDETYQNPRPPPPVPKPKKKKRLRKKKSVLKTVPIKPDLSNQLDEQLQMSEDQPDVQMAPRLADSQVSQGQSEQAPDQPDSTHCQSAISSLPAAVNTEDSPNVTTSSAWCLPQLDGMMDSGSSGECSTSGESSSETSDEASESTEQGHVSRFRERSNSTDTLSQNDTSLESRSKLESSPEPGTNSSRPQSPEPYGRYKRSKSPERHVRSSHRQISDLHVRPASRPEHDSFTKSKERQSSDSYARSEHRHSLDASEWAKHHHRADSSGRSKHHHHRTDSSDRSKHHHRTDSYDRSKHHHRTDSFDRSKHRHSPDAYDTRRHRHHTDSYERSTHSHIQDSYARSKHRQSPDHIVKHSLESRTQRYRSPTQEARREEHPGTKYRDLEKADFLLSRSRSEKRGDTQRSYESRYSDHPQGASQWQEHSHDAPRSRRQETRDSGQRDRFEERPTERHFDVVRSTHSQKVSLGRTDFPRMDSRSNGQENKPRPFLSGGDQPSSEYKTVLKRHINQLFIRGDNVVLVTPAL